MKNLLIATLVYAGAFSLAEAQECKTTNSEIVQDVVYNVNKDIPAHLKGAKIIVRLADGKETVVPAEQFMVVKRKQYTVAGQNRLVMSKLRCEAKSRKNSVMVDARKDHSGMDTSTATIPGGVQATVKSNKALTPGINYYRREILDSHLGLGAGVDSNGTLKAIIGLDF